ncbi:MAG TPA: oligosaccharide flippase family protein [Sphingomonas sp.]|nr:oligosaccharide flippase family protein [Sphingomonas sp.]
MSGDKGTFRKNIVWQLVGNGGQSLIGVVTLVLMGRTLGTHDFGVFAIVMGLVYVATGLFEPRMQDVAAKQFWNIGAPDTVEQHIPYFLDLLLVETLAKLLPCLVLVAISPLLVEINQLDHNYAIIPVAALGYYLAKIGNGLALGTLRVLGRSDLSSACLIGEQALRLAIMVVMVMVGYLTALDAVIALCAAGIVANLVQWWFVRRQFRRVHVDLKGWRWREALERLEKNKVLLLSNLGLSASDLMNKDLDITIVSPMMSPSAIGLYKMAKNIVMLAWKAIDPVYLALMPEMNRLVAQHRYAEVKRLVLRVTVGLLAFSLFLAAGLGGGTWLLGGFVFGAEFADIKYYIPYMLLGIVIAAPLIWGHSLLVALDRPQGAVYGILAGGLLGVAALFLFTPELGLYGAILGWLVSFCLNFIFMAVAAWRRLNHVAHSADVTGAEQR